MNADKVIFTELLKSKIFTLDNQESYILISDIVEFIIKYEELGVITYKDNTIALTDIGLRYLLKNRNHIFLKKSDRPWDEIPDCYKSEKLDSNSWLKVIFKGVKRTSY